VEPGTERGRCHLPDVASKYADHILGNRRSTSSFQQVISGQHIAPGLASASLFVEVEVFGVLADCAKERTKVVPRNGVNPIWTQTFTFRVITLD